MHQALIVLQKGVQQCFPDDQPLTDPKRIQIKGNAMLLVGRYMEETANFESNAIMKTYKVCQSITFTFMDKCQKSDSSVNVSLSCRMSHICCQNGRMETSTLPNTMTRLCLWSLTTNWKDRATSFVILSLILESKMFYFGNPPIGRSFSSSE